MNLMKFQIIEFLKEVLKEDIGRGDLARNLLPNKTVNAKVIAKSEGIVAGIEYIKHFSYLADIKFDFNFEDGDFYKKGDVIFIISGNTKDILSLERSILNILQHASGIASNAYEFTKKTKKLKILDTRKTRPLLRTFEKYAAKCGGITNHRLGLDDCLMLKDTHLAIFKSIKEAISKARSEIPFTTKIEVECESFTQAKEAMEAGADIVMCDNMDFEEIKKTVEYRDQNFKNIFLEASGNITLDNIQKYEETGIDAISSGAIIHQATFKDFSMKII